MAITSRVTVRRRIDLVFGISSSDDMKKVQEALTDLAASDPRILKDSTLFVAVTKLKDSCLKLVCRPWVKLSDYWSVYCGLMEKSKVTLEDDGMPIPFPQRDIHDYKENPAEKKSARL